MSGSEEKSEQEHEKLIKSFFSTYEIFVSTYDISSIKRVITRKSVKFHVVVVQQQRQRNVQKKSVMHVQSCFFY